MPPELAFDDLQPHFRDPIQRRYELLRPRLLFQDRSARQRAEETQRHPETLRAFKRRFEPHGMRGLLPGHLHLGPAGRHGRVPDAVVAALSRLQGLYDGFQYRERGPILLHKLDYHVSDKTITKRWSQLPAASPPPLPLLDYHRYPERSQARQQVITLSLQGWNKRSIRRFLHVSRPTINQWIARFARDNFAGLEDQSRAPKAPVRKVWLPVMLAV